MPIIGGTYGRSNTTQLSSVDREVSGPAPDARPGGGGSRSGGTVRSVAMTVPSALLAVAGSPIKQSGTLALTLPTRAANLIFAGPASGAAAAPTFREAVPADLPTATEVAQGAVMLATVSEAIDGTNDTDAVTPEGVAAAIAASGGGIVSGTFDPVFTFATPGNLSVAYSTRAASYLRIGNLVFVSGFLVFTPTHTTASGRAQVSGFPYAAALNSHGLLVGFSSITFAAGTHPFLTIETAQSLFSMWSWGSAATAVAWSTAQFPTATARNIQFALTYIAS